jgi:hypothetical protein
MYAAARESGAFDGEGWWKMIDMLELGESWRNGVEVSGRRWGVGDLMKEGGEHLALRSSVEDFESYANRTSGSILAMCSRPDDDLPDTILPRPSRQAR